MGTALAQLDSSEIAARIKAARLLREMSQRELARKLVESGLPFRLVGQLERGEVELRSAHRAALAEALGFAEHWFTLPTDDLCPPDPPAANLIERLDRIIALLGGQELAGD